MLSGVSFTIFGQSPRDAALSSIHIWRNASSPRESVAMTPILRTLSHEFNLTFFLHGEMLLVAPPTCCDGAFGPNGPCVRKGFAHFFRADKKFNLIWSDLTQFSLYTYLHLDCIQYLVAKPIMFVNNCFFYQRAIFIIVLKIMAFFFDWGEMSLRTDLPPQLIRRENVGFLGEMAVPDYPLKPFRVSCSYSWRKVLPGITNALLPETLLSSCGNRVRDRASWCSARMSRQPAAYGRCGKVSRNAATPTVSPRPLGCWWRQNRGPGQRPRSPDSWYHYLPEEGGGHAMPSPLEVPHMPRRGMPISEREGG